MPSHIALAADENVAGGLLLQQVPGHAIDADDWARLGYLAATLGCRDFGADAGIGLLARLFAEDDVRVYDPRAVSFRCRCSARKAEDVLRMLGQEEARAAVAEQVDIEVTCEYCGRQRAFDTVDIERLFADNVVTGPDSRH